MGLNLTRRYSKRHDSLCVVTATGILLCVCVCGGCAWWLIYYNCNSSHTHTHTTHTPQRTRTATHTAAKQPEPQNLSLFSIEILDLISDFFVVAALLGLARIKKQFGKIVLVSLKIPIVNVFKLL
jgi:hypothetical protein